jgi:alkanesulfonate monooxygenase SsuD/methylene tetrahydromethanopterin reductase-like flavin-dependent oxidoreductase (luciferase family)
LSAKGFNRVVRYCDGWIPTGVTIEDLPAAITTLHDRARQAGRQPSEVPVSIFGAAAEEAVLRRYQELGIERAVFTVPSRERDHVLPLLDTYAELVAKLA